MAACSSYLGPRGEWLVGTKCEQRMSSRHLVVASCTLVADGTRHVGLVRDISRDGLFAYSDFHPALGSAVRITIAQATTEAAFTCIGVVVRAEVKRPGTAAGIAVRITGFEF